MRQPESLKTEAYQPWSRGRGVDVWDMLRSSAEGDRATLQELVDRVPQLVDCEYAYYRPLHFAVLHNQLDAVQFLLDRGADPMCGGLGYQPAYRPAKSANHPWPLTVARDRGYHEVSALLELVLRERFHIRPEGEIVAAAIRERDATRVRQLIATHPDWIDAADGFGSQPIHWATMTRQLPVIDFLLDHGADINASRPDGAQPIDLTNGDYGYRGWRDVPREALRPHEVVLGYLLARGAYYDISTAAQLGDLDRVRTLLSENPHLANAVPPSSGYYNGVPLRCAAGGGHLPVVRLLLDYGADPNQAEAVAPRGGALYDAIAGKHWDIVKLLVSCGADPNAMIESSGNCFWRAKRDHAPQEIISLLATHGGCIGVELACHDLDLESVGMMLHADPQLPIHEHLPTDNREFVELVLRYQPDVLQRVEFRGAPTREQFKWLVERGMDPTRSDWLGITPLHRFALQGNLELARAVVEAGATLNAVDDLYSSTPLGWAARGGQPEMVAWLLTQNADRHLPHDIAWAQPLEWARRAGDAPIVQLLESSPSPEI